MDKDFKSILKFTIISSVILVCMNRFISSLFYIVLSNNYDLVYVLPVVQAVISFVVWGIFGYVLRHKVASGASNKKKLTYYLLNIISISILILAVEYIAYLSSYIPVNQQNYLFGTFIGLKNDWFSTINIVALSFLNRDNLISIQSIGLLDIISIFIIILGVISGFSIRQIRRGSGIK